MIKTNVMRILEKEKITFESYEYPHGKDAVDGITIEVPAPNKIVISGADKQLVGHIAAIIREKRLPEPYKGKGIKYVDEYIRRKEGKAGKSKS